VERILETDAILKNTNYKNRKNDKNLLGPYETLTHGQLDAELDARAHRAGTYHRSAKDVRDIYLQPALAERLRKCWSFWKVWYDKSDPNGLRKKSLYLCREVLCPYCGPFMHAVNRQDYVRRLQTLHPDGESLDVIHLVFTVPDWMWPIVLRKPPVPPAPPKPRPTAEAGQNAPAGASKRGTRPKTGTRTTPGLEAMKEAMKGALADLYFEGSKLRLAQSAAILCNLHVLGDKPEEWPTLKPHLDVVLAGHILRENTLEPLPKWIPRRDIEQLPRNWATRLKSAMRPHAKSLEEHMNLEAMEWAMVKVANGSRGHGIHRTEGHAWHTVDYSTRPMFCLKWAKIVGPDGTTRPSQPLDTLEYAPKLKRIRFLQDGTVRGPVGTMRVRAPIRPAMNTINQALDLMKGAHVHALMGTFNANYKTTMTAIGRTPIPLHGAKDDAEWGLDRIIAKMPDGKYYDPGPQKREDLPGRGSSA
jgi:hypothetical protein